MISSPLLNEKTAKTLAKLDKVCFLKDAWSKKDWLSYFSDTIEVYFMSENNKIIGYIVWDINRISGIAYLASIAILSKYQGKGNAKKLLTYNIEDLTKMGITTLFAHTRMTNYPSQKLLKSFGFSINSYASGYYYDEDGIEWKK